MLDERVDVCGGSGKRAEMDGHISRGEGCGVWTDLGNWGAGGVVGHSKAVGDVGEGHGDILHGETISRRRIEVLDEDEGERNSRDVADGQEVAHLEVSRVFAFGLEGR